jgi:hypothetical protein
MESPEPETPPVLIDITMLVARYAHFTRRRTLWNLFHTELFFG